MSTEGTYQMMKWGKRRKAGETTEQPEEAAEQQQAEEAEQQHAEDQQPQPQPEPVQQPEPEPEPRRRRPAREPEPEPEVMSPLRALGSEVEELRADLRQPTERVCRVTCPDGVRAGDTIEVEVDEISMQLEVPAGVAPGEVFEIVLGPDGGADAEAENAAAEQAALTRLRKERRAAERRRQRGSPPAAKPARQRPAAGDQRRRMAPGRTPPAAAALTGSLLAEAPKVSLSSFTARQDMHIEEQRQRRREREEAREMEAAPKQKRVDTTAFLARLEESNKVRSAQPKRPWPDSQLAHPRWCGAAKAGEFGGEAGAAAEKGRADVHRCATDQRQIEAAAGWQRYRRLLGETHRDPAAPQHAQPRERDARSRHLPGLQHRY